MKQKRDTTNNGKLTGVDSALRRASRKARELAVKTGTPLVIYSEGKIKKIRIHAKSATRPT
ncbi:MAG: hypothetical protein ABJB97_07895 [Acidobacteriota bacterium]